MNTLFYMHISIYKVHLNQWLERIMLNMGDRHPIVQIYTFSWFLNVTVQWHHTFLHRVVHWYNIFDWKTVWHSCFSPTWDTLTVAYSLFQFHTNKQCKTEREKHETWSSWMHDWKCLQCLRSSNCWQKLAGGLLFSIKNTAFAMHTVLKKFSALSGN